MESIFLNKVNKIYFRFITYFDEILENSFLTYLNKKLDDPLWWNHDQEDWDPVLKDEKLFQTIITHPKMLDDFLEDPDLVEKYSCRRILKRIVQDNFFDWETKFILEDSLMYIDGLYLSLVISFFCFIK